MNINDVINESYQYNKHQGVFLHFNRKLKSPLGMFRIKMDLCYDIAMLSHEYVIDFIKSLYKLNIKFIISFEEYSDKINDEVKMYYFDGNALHIINNKSIKYKDSLLIDTPNIDQYNLIGLT